MNSAVWRLRADPNDTVGSATHRNLSNWKINGNKPVINEDDMSLRAARNDIPTLSALMEKVNKGRGATNKTHGLMYVLKSPLLPDVSVTLEKFSLRWHEIEAGNSNRLLFLLGRVSKTISNILFVLV